MSQDFYCLKTYADVIRLKVCSMYCRYAESILPGNIFLTISLSVSSFMALNSFTLLTEKMLKIGKHLARDTSRTYTSGAESTVYHRSKYLFAQSEHSILSYHLIELDFVKNSSKFLGDC